MPGSTSFKAGGGGGSYTSSESKYGSPVAQPSTPTPVVVSVAKPVEPIYEPKLEANALYGKPMALFSGGFARIGASPSPIVGPYFNQSAKTVDLVVSFGVAVPVTGDRKIYAIYLDSELAWSSAAGGTLPADGTFASEPFDFIFKPGTLTQTACSLESEKFPGDENAYRPQMLLQIRGLPYSRFVAKTGKPVPYVACDIGDVTDGADPADGINVGEGWERIARSPWPNYSSSTAEYVGVVDLADAYLLKDNFTMVGLGQAVTRTHRTVDLLQSDKLRLKDRGNVTPDFVFDRNSIIGAAGPVQIIRASATSQRRELELLAIDPDQDYTTVPSLSKIPRDPFVISAAVGKETITSPLVLDANSRQALVTFAQQYEENARKTITFKVGARGYGIEPGDLAGLSDIADGVDDEVWKVTQTEHLGDFTVAVEAEAILRCRVALTSTITLAFHVYAHDSADLTTYEFAAIPIGDAASDRYVIVGVVGSAQTRTVNSMTVGGVTASLIVRRNLTVSEGPSSVTAEMWIALVPSGTTADIDVVWSGQNSRCAIGIWTATGLASGTAFDTGGGNVQVNVVPDNVTLNSVPGGIVIAMGIHHNTSSGTIDWTGSISEDFFDEFAEISTVTFGGASATTIGTSVTLAPVIGAVDNGNSPYVVATFA